MKLSVELRDTGPVVRGGVRVLEGGSSRSLTVSLQYREQSPDYTHTAVDVPGGVLHTGDLQDGMWFEFAIQMPADALPGQRFRHGETYWQVDVKSDEAGLDTHAVARLTEPQPPQASAPVPPTPPPPASTPADSSGAPLLAPGYSAKAAGRADSNPVRGVVTIIAAIAIGGVGIWSAVAGFSDEPETTTVPVYRPQPYTPTFGGDFDLNACTTAAAGDPDLQLRCIREYNRSITEQP